MAAMWKNTLRGSAAAPAAAAVLFMATAPAAAQEVALKGGAAVSRFAAEGQTQFPERLVSTAFGAHARFRFGPVALQPEVLVVTKGGSGSEGDAEEQLRLEYLEVPVLLVVPVRVGAFEPYAFAGPMAALETRCRWVTEDQGLKTNFGCDPPRDPLFERRLFDWGAVAGAGVAHRLGDGRLMLEARYTLGLRNIYAGSPEFSQQDVQALRNRTWMVVLGYTLTVEDSR